MKKTQIKKEKWENERNPLEEELVKVKGESGEWQKKYFRALADYQNLERRTACEISDKEKLANARLLKSLLPVGDTLRMAQAHLSDPGLELALKQWADVLTGAGVHKIDTLGKKFDPKFMECVDVIDGEQDEVIEEVLTGYTLHGTLLRAAKVKVGKKMEAKNN